MTHILVRTITLIAALGLTGLCLASGSSPAPEPNQAAEPQLTAEQQADVLYNEGLGYRNASWKMTTKTRGTSGSETREDREEDP